MGRSSRSKRQDLEFIKWEYQASLGKKPDQITVKDN